MGKKILIWEFIKSRAMCDKYINRTTFSISIF